MPKSILLILFIFISILTYGQNIAVSGRLMDIDQFGLPMANVSLTSSSDSTKKWNTISDDAGNFRFTNMQSGGYVLETYYFGYESLIKQIKLENDNLELGDIFLNPKTQTLNTQVLKGKIPPSVLRGDTTEINAGSYKTNPNATAEDLIQKMPGVTNDGGTIKVQGEEVRKVLIDGKPFFGDDPAAALKNLPAEIISKIQFLDKMSDQSAFTGFNNGDTEKTINIITKAGNKEGQFGKIVLGYGTDNRYIASGNINLFKNNQRISILGLSNNINQQNFSASDLLGVSGGSGRGGGGRGGSRGSGGGSYGGSNNNFLVGAQSGIATTNSLGINFSDSLGKKMEVSGSYFFNNSRNENFQEINRDYFPSGELTQAYTESNITLRNNLNHRVNLRLEYTLDSNNSFIFTPRASFQKNTSSREFTAISSLNNSPVSQSRSEFNNNGQAYNIGGSVLYRHKFEKPKRTGSVNLDLVNNNRAGNNDLDALNTIYQNATVIESNLNQQTDNTVSENSIGSRFTFTEPLGKNSLLQLNYSNQFSKNSSQKYTSGSSPMAPEMFLLDTTLSSKFYTNTLINRAGPTYQYSTKALNFSLGADLQKADLNGKAVFPYSSDIDRTFYNFLPSAMLRLNSEKGRNIRMYYRTNTNLPSVVQLQDVIDNSNPILLTTGNQRLRQEVRHNVILRYNKANTSKSTSLFGFMRLTTSQSFIGSSVTISEKDSTLQNGLILRRGSQITTPENLSGYYGFNTFGTYGFPIDSLKIKLNINAGYSYNRIPGIVNSIRNFSNSSGFNLGAVVASNINENIDFTFSTTSNYTLVNNSIRPELNNNYYNQTTTFKSNFIILKNFVFNQELSHMLYRGLGSQFNTSFLLWNISAGKKIFKNKNGEIKVTIFDLLNQNQSISREVTETYVQDTRSLVLKRYFMVTFLYNLKNFKALSEKQK